MTPSIARLHAWAAMAWLVGALVSPPMEGAAFAALALAALIRWREFVQRMVGDRDLCFTLLLMLLTLGWAWLSRAWSPAGVNGKLHVRVLLAPFMIVHAGLTLRQVLCAMALPGLWWALVLGIAWCGVPLGDLVPEHPSRAMLGLLTLGAACVAQMQSWVGWGKVGWLAVAWLAWGVGAAVASSRAGVVAVAASALITTAVSRRSVRKGLLAVMAAGLALALSVTVLWFTPVGYKMRSTFDAAVSADSGDPFRFDLHDLDTLLSMRLSLWDWTLASARREVVGHGAGSWEHHVRDPVIGATRDRSGYWLDQRRAFGLDHAHMLPLQLFYEQGLVGLVLLVGFALMLAEWAWKARLTKAGVLGLSTLVAFSVLSLVEGALLTRATAAALAVVVAIRSIDAAATEPG